MHFPRAWSLVCLMMALTAGGVHVLLLADTTARSRPGLLFAFLGCGCVGFCALLTVRRKLSSGHSWFWRALRFARAWRIVKTSIWRNGHPCVGLLGVVFFHCHAGGLRWGGALTTALMLLLWSIVGSGLLGLFFQVLQKLKNQAVKANTAANPAKTAAGKASPPAGSRVSDSLVLAARLIDWGYTISLKTHLVLTSWLLILTVYHAIGALYF